MPVVQHKFLLLPRLLASAAGCSSRNALQSFHCSISSLLWIGFQQALRGYFKLSRVLQAQLTLPEEKCHSSSVLSLQVSMWTALADPWALPIMSGLKSRAQSIWLMAVEIQSSCFSCQILSLCFFCRTQINILKWKSYTWFAMFPQPEAGKIHDSFPLPDDNMRLPVVSDVALQGLFSCSHTAGTGRKMWPLWNAEDWGGFRGHPGGRVTPFIGVLPAVSSWALWDHSWRSHIFTGNSAST